jgi:hypothetical protein
VHVRRPSDAYNVFFQQKHLRKICMILDIFTLHALVRSYAKIVSNFFFVSRTVSSAGMEIISIHTRIACVQSY